ncbi:immunity 49 family protein [Natronobiforma cellulositropha]|uniref:immunity 49 family protein n=1 Tax=Natronobiforma cellulositropha TaxID=1679076 RepID=UPI0021D5D1EE|nr:immunity 49 family protein [Natronobiforma cellulositropha]
MISENRLEAIHERVREDIEFRLQRWNKGEIADQIVPKHKYGVAGRYQTLGHCNALLGNGEMAQEAYAEATVYYLERVQEARKRRDDLDPTYWEHEPAVLVSAMTAAQLAEAGELLADAARKALAMDEAYLDRFAPEYDDSPFRFYNAQVRGVIVLDDDRQSDLLDAYRDAVAGLNNPYAETMGDVYAAIIDGDAAGVVAGLETLLGNHDETVTASTDHPDDFIADTPAALCLLVRDRGLDVTIRSEYVPDVLVPTDAKHVVGQNGDRTDQGDANVDIPHVERDDETGGYVIVETITHPGGRDLTAEDVPKTEKGRLLSEEWLDAVIDELQSADEAFPQELGKELQIAHEKGVLARKLVVLQERTGAHTFGESVSELGVDQIELVKGTGDTAN